MSDPPLRVEDLTRMLDFSARDLTELPVNLKDFVHLEDLSLSNNYFDEIPDVLFQLPALSRINLEHNKIKSHDDLSFVKWKQVTLLKLGYNLFEKIPSSVNFLQNLEIFELQHNKITSLPEEICLLQELTSLNVSHNSLVSLPQSLSELKSLKILQADVNQITSFPSYPSNHRTLQRISLKHNPLALPSKSLSILEANGVTIILTSGSFRKEKRTSLPDASTLSGGDESDEDRPIKRSSSEGSKIVDDIVHSASFTRKLPKSFSSSISRTKARVRSRADLPGSLKVPRSPRKRSSVAETPVLISWDSIRPHSNEIEPLPKKIKELGSIEYFVENEAACVLAATKDQLVALLSYDSGVDMERFQKIFLCTYPAFMESEDFLQAMIVRFKQSKTVVGRNRVIDILSLWIDIQRVHIRENEELKRQVLQFVNQTAEHDKYAKKFLSIMAKLNDGVSSLPSSSTSGLPEWQMLKSKELGRQLCIINSRLLKKIPLPDLLDGKYNKQPSFGEVTAINTFATWFNIECNWAATAILNTNGFQETIYVITLFVSVIAKCLALKNFSSAMSIYSALNLGAVQRLTTAWANISPKTARQLLEFDQIFSFKNNFGEYREILKSVNGPCIPIFSVLARDLTHIEENRKVLPDDKINFQRLHSLAQHFIMFRNYQLYGYDFERDFEGSARHSYYLEQQLRAILPYTKDELYRLADEKEARDIEDQNSKRKKKVSLRDFRELSVDRKQGPESPRKTDSPESGRRRSKSSATPVPKIFLTTSDGSKEMKRKRRISQQVSEQE